MENLKVTWPDLPSITKHSVSNCFGFVIMDHKLLCCFKILGSYLEPGNVSWRKLILVTLPTQSLCLNDITSAVAVGEVREPSGAFPED